MAHDIQEVRNTLERIAPDLHRGANVVATGVGYKVTQGRRTADLSIVCSVTRKQAAAQLASMDPRH